MILQQNFQSLPPKLFLMQILDGLSKVYVFLWDKKDDHNRLDLSYKDLSKIFNKNMFRQNIRKLNNFGLLSYDESETGLSIELVGYDDID